MRLYFILIYLGCIIVSAKKHKHKKAQENTTTTTETTKTKMRHIGSESGSAEVPHHFTFVDTYLDLRGSMRQQFALEAALVDHARNMICSPMSALMPLGKLALGAEGRSERELLSALGLQNIGQVETAFSHLITNMQYLPGVTLDVASRIYIGLDKSLNKKFVQQTKLIFKSSCQRIDMDEPSESASTINNWVSEKTRGKIRKLVRSSDITRDTSVFLVNAIYFAGNWNEQFSQSYTGDFHSPIGTRRIPMMRRQGTYNHYQCDTLNAQIVEIPYEGEQAAMIIVLPYSKNGLPVLLRALKSSPESLNRALEKMKKTDLILSMPKFKIETELDIGSLYKRVGLQSLFEPKRSKLTGIVEDETVFISKAIQKAVIEVNEKGTEASVATGNIMDLSLGPLNLPIFCANRPFMFHIVFLKEQLFSGIYSG